MTNWASGDVAGWVRRRWWLAAGGALAIVAIVAVGLFQGRATITGSTPEERAASIGRIVDQKKSGADEVVAGAVNDPEPKVREAAIVGLGRLGCRPDLVRAGLRDADPSVRYAAAVTLGATADPSAASALADVVAKGGDARTRMGAVLGLARLGTPEATCHVVRAMDVADPQVQVTAMNAISAAANIRWDTPPDPSDRGEWARKVELVRKMKLVRRAFAEQGRR